MMPEYSSAVADKRANEYLDGRGFDYRNQPSNVPYGMAPDEEQQMLKVLEGQIGSLMDSMNPNLRGEGSAALTTLLRDPSQNKDFYNKYQQYRLSTPDDERGIDMQPQAPRGLEALMRALGR